MYTMRKRGGTEEGFQGWFEDLSNISIVKTSCKSSLPPIPGPCNDKYKCRHLLALAKPLNVLSLDTRNFQWIFHLALLSSIRLYPLFGYVNGNRRIESYFIRLLTFVFLYKLPDLYGKGLLIVSRLNFRRIIFHTSFSFYSIIIVNVHVKIACKASRTGETRYYTWII